MHSNKENTCARWFRELRDESGDTWPLCSWLEHTVMKSERTQAKCVCKCVKLEKSWFETILAWTVAPPGWKSSPDPGCVNDWSELSVTCLLLHLWRGVGSWTSCWIMWGHFFSLLLLLMWTPCLIKWTDPPSVQAYEYIKQGHSHLAFSIKMIHVLFVYPLVQTIKVSNGTRQSVCTVELALCLI